MLRATGTLLFLFQQPPWPTFCCHLGVSAPGQLFLSASSDAEGQRVQATVENVAFLLPESIERSQRLWNICSRWLSILPGALFSPLFSARHLYIFSTSLHRSIVEGMSVDFHRVQPPLCGNLCSGHLCPWANSHCLIMLNLHRQLETGSQVVWY